VTGSTFFEASLPSDPYEGQDRVAPGTKVDIATTLSASPIRLWSTAEPTKKDSRPKTAAIQQPPRWSTGSSLPAYVRQQPGRPFGRGLASGWHKETHVALKHVCVLASSMLTACTLAHIPILSQSKPRISRTGCEVDRGHRG